MRPNCIVTWTSWAIRAIDDARRPEDLAAGAIQRDPAIVATETPAADPGDLAHRPQLVEEPRLVARDPRGQHVALEDGTVWTKALPRLAEALSRRESPFVLVLDGADALTRDSISTLTALLEHVPTGSMIALAGRVTPNLPVAALRARVVGVRTVEVGGTVSYGATWRANRPTTVATGMARAYASPVERE